MTQEVALVFARRPVPGRVKTRLARTEGAAAAARIYRALAEAVFRTVTEDAVSHGRRVIVCVAEGADTEAVAAWLDGAETWAQGPGDLGARMQRMTSRAFADGARRVVVVGTDIVGLTPEVLARSFQELRDHDAVLAPVPDGGYGLVGLAAPAPALFRGVAWGTPAVAEDTRARAKDAALRMAEVEGLRDVDTADDLPGALPAVSVLVPVLDDAPALALLLDDLRREAREVPLEVIVADGGSTDGGVEVARDAGVRRLRTKRGRGIQLAAAADVATAPWLWTLHADTRVAPGTAGRLLRRMRRTGRPWAFFETGIAASDVYLRRAETMNAFRARVFRLPYGDQGIVVHRQAYDLVGGYAEVPLMEDVLLARRLARFGVPACIGGGLTTNARRWLGGPRRTTVSNLWTLFRFLVLRRDPATLAASYARSRS